MVGTVHFLHPAREFSNKYPNYGLNSCNKVRENLIVARILAVAGGLCDGCQQNSGGTQGGEGTNRRGHSEPRAAGEGTGTKTRPASLLDERNRCQAAQRASARQQEQSARCHCCGATQGAERFFVVTVQFNQTPRAGKIFPALFHSKLNPVPPRCPSLAVEACLWALYIHVLAARAGRGVPRGPAVQGPCPGGQRRQVRDPTSRPQVSIPAGRHYGPPCWYPCREASWRERPAARLAPQNCCGASPSFTRTFVRRPPRNTVKTIVSPPRFRLSSPGRVSLSCIGWSSTAIIKSPPTPSR